MYINIKIYNKNYNLKNDNIETIALFGSYARGDADDTSDIDIFVLINDCSEQEFIKQKKGIVKSLDVPSDWVSVYRLSSVKEMYKYGSYFLWHLKTEGKILFSRTGILEKTLATLPQYVRVEQDLNDYLTICSDIQQSLSEDASTILYEMAVMASLVRNTCIALAYINGRMAFGRTYPVIIAKELIGDEFPFQIDEYNVLYKYRIHYIRGKNVASSLNVLNMAPEFNTAKWWADRIERLIRICLSKFRQKE